MSCLVCSCSLLAVSLAEKIREFNNFAVRRGGQEFPDNNISLVERLVRGNEWCSAAADVLWQMLQWPDGRFNVILILVICSNLAIIHTIATWSLLKIK